MPNLFIAILTNKKILFVWYWLCSVHIVKSCANETSVNLSTTSVHICDDVILMVFYRRYGEVKVWSIFYVFFRKLGVVDNFLKIRFSFVSVLTVIFLLLSKLHNKTRCLFLADRTIGRACGTVCRLSVVCDVLYSGETAGPICMKFSGKVWTDHGTTWLHFGSIRVNRAMPRC